MPRVTSIAPLRAVRPTRREAIVLALCVATAGETFFATGCSSKGEGEGQAVPADEPFDRDVFTVSDAFGPAYDDVLAVARQTAEDALPIAVRFTCEVEPGVAPVWDYLFASQQEHSYYVAFTRSDTVMARMGTSYIKGPEWAQIPTVENVKVDATQAYELACDLAQREGLPLAQGLYAFLTLYSEPAGESDPSYEYEDEGMTWYFEFNPTQGEDAAQVGYVEDLGKEPKTPAKTPRMYCIAVNAANGEAAVAAR